MTPLNSSEVVSVVSAVTSPVSDNFLAIVTILATVAGLYLVIKFIKKGAR